MNRAILYFTAPGFVEVREEPLSPPPPRTVLVKTLFSAISAGSELLIYRGLCPRDLPLDQSIPSLQGKSMFPLKYGYSAIGTVIGLGYDVPDEWYGRTVFSFHPHESHFITETSELLPLPDNISPEEALFLPNMETAINFVMDGRPLIGEQVIVFGQGVVGLLTTALLAMYPLTNLLTVDRYPLRHEASLNSGANRVFNSGNPDHVNDIMDRLKSADNHEGADLTYEISGSPEALEQAISVTGFDGRIIIGSWFGMKPVHLNLGGRFHRSRIKMIASQVSTLNPHFTGRWTKSRRISLIWPLIKKINPVRFITQRFSFNDADKAYNLLDRQPEKCLQVIFKY
ncbi:MAG: zinc-binding alcohol dehydrogenase [Smithella sp.]